jgi:hypothetical protein
MTSADPKKRIRQILHSVHPIPFRIKYKEPSREHMNKMIFVRVINNLKKIEDRRDFLLDEIGMDMTAYEDQFFSIIEDLFKMTFSKEQLALIQMYLYQLVPDKDWDGTITIETKSKGEKVVNFETAQDVWDVLKTLDK